MKRAIDGGSLKQMGKEYAYEPIGLSSRRRQRSHIAVGLGGFAVVVVLLATHRDGLGGSDASPAAPDPRRGPWQQPAATTTGAVDAPRNLKLKTAYGRVPSLDAWAAPPQKRK